jgi:GNAT superfamily N-acetyltransferase
VEVIAQFNIALARETESLELEPARATAGVQALLLDPAKGSYFVAVNGNEVVGQLLITHEWSDWRNGDFWWLQSVYVRPDFRRRGVFKSLFDFVQAKATGAPDVCGFRLYMEAGNSRAREAYRRLGMTETHYHVFERLLR